MGLEVGYLFPTQPHDRDMPLNWLHYTWTKKLMERFDRKDPEIHFRELAQLKQIGSAEAFISEF